MNKTEQGNHLLNRFLGYKYKYVYSCEKTLCGGFYETTEFYSKTPFIFGFDSYPINEDRIKLEICAWYLSEPQTLTYHTDWNKLILVCEKILEYYGGNTKEVFQHLVNFKKENLFWACVEFVEELNNPQQKRLETGEEVDLLSEYITETNGK